MTNEKKIGLIQGIISLVGLLCFSCIFIFVSKDVMSANMEERADMSALRVFDFKEKQAMKQRKNILSDMNIDQLSSVVCDAIAEKKEDMKGVILSFENMKAEADTLPADSNDFLEESGAYDAETSYENADVAFSQEYSPEELRFQGEIYDGGWRYTWYSENVLPGGGLEIPGRWSDGDFVRDENSYICLASSDLDYGSVIDTPWGVGKVYDSGCDSGTLDVYVSW